MISIVFGFVSFALGAGPHWSLETLSAGANVVRQMADGQRICDLSSQKALSISMPIKALIDEEMERFRTSQEYSRFLNSDALLNCKKKCHCGVYLDLLNQDPDPSKEIQEKISRLQKLQISPVESLKCAKSNLWFCKSHLLKYLLKHATE